MGIRGRKSADALSVVPASSVVSIVRRPEPPDELTPEEAEEWRAVVNSLAADWFRRETHALLVLYCRHVVNARCVAQLIQTIKSKDPVDIDGYDRLLKMQERESRALSSLATRMRTSQHSNYAKDKKRGPVIESWDADGL